MKQLSFVFILAIGFLSLSCSDFARTQKSDNIDLKYKAAVKYFQNKEYHKAATLFEELIPILKGQAEAEKAQYYFAYCQYYQGQLVLSAYYFKKYYETFPRNEKGEECYYMHCISLYEDSPEYELDQTNTFQALSAIQVFLEKFPSTKFLTECNAIVDKLQYKLEMKAYNQSKLFYRMRDYRATVITFTNLIKDFPSSKYLEEAHFIKVDAQYRFANMSIDSKKRERYQAAVDYYYIFIDKYSSSKNVKDAEKIYEQIQIKLAELDNPKKKATWWDWLI